MWGHSWALLCAASGSSARRPGFTLLSLLLEGVSPPRLMPGALTAPKWLPCVAVVAFGTPMAMVGIPVDMLVMMLTTQAQPPDHVWLDVQTKIDVIRTSHKWLGCCLCLPEDQDADVELHLSAAARAFWANKCILCDKHVPIELRCFGAGHRDIYQHQLQIRCGMATIATYVVGSPAGTGLEHAVASDFAQLEQTRP